MHQSDVYYQLLSQHVSGIIIPIFRRTKTVCYCIRCTALVLLDVVGSGCGALLCRMRTLWKIDVDTAEGDLRNSRRVAHRFASHVVSSRFVRTTPHVRNKYIKIGNNERSKLQISSLFVIILHFSPQNVIMILITKSSNSHSSINKMNLWMSGDVLQKRRLL